MSAGDNEAEPFVDNSPVQETSINDKYPIRSACEYITVILFLLPSIVGIIIAYQYNPEISPCKDTPDGVNYTIKLDIFLYVGGGVMIATTLCNCICALLSKNGKDRVQCGTGIILFVWIIIGLNMYNMQMSKECKDTPIAKMILSWCLIPLVIIGIALLALCIPFCRIVREWMKHQV